MLNGKSMASKSPTVPTVHLSLPSCQKSLSFNHQLWSFQSMLALNQNFADEFGRVTAMAAD